MASNGDPEDPSDDPDDYPGVEETQYANYGGTDSTAYSESYELLPEPSQRMPCRSSEITRTSWRAARSALHSCRHVLSRKLTTSR